MFCNFFSVFRYCIIEMTSLLGGFNIQTKYIRLLSRCLHTSVHHLALPNLPLYPLLLNLRVVRSEASTSFLLVLTGSKFRTPSDKTLLFFSGIFIQPFYFLREPAPPFLLLSTFLILPLSFSLLATLLPHLPTSPSSSSPLFFFSFFLILPPFSRFGPRIAPHVILTMTCLAAISYNVKGLNSPEKHTKLLGELWRQKSQLIFLQETHFKKSAIPKLGNGRFPTV